MPKCHLKICSEPMQTMGTEKVLCEVELPHARSVMEISGDIASVRELVADFKGLCRKCRKLFLDREESAEREWVYFLSEGIVEVEGRGEKLKEREKRYVYAVTEGICN